MTYHATDPYPRPVVMSRPIRAAVRVDALGEVPGDGAAGHDRLVVGMSVDEQQPAIRRDTGHVSSQLTAVPKIETWMGPVSGTSRTADVVPTTIESWYSGR